MKIIGNTIEVKTYSGEPRESFDSLFSKYSYGRYCRDLSLDLQVSRHLELDQLFSYLKQNPGTSWVAFQGQEIVGVLGLKISKWDTDFWGLNYANIDYLVVQSADFKNAEMIAGKLAQVVDEWASQVRLDFISARVDVFDLPVAHVLEEHGFKYIETTITNSYNLKRLDPTPPEDYVIRLAQPDETDLLIDMSKNGFLTHRFYADTRFPKQKVDEMYYQWVQNSLGNPSIWTTVVLETDHQVRGFMTYRLEDLNYYFGKNFVKWRMAALGKDDRGKGHGVNLFIGAMKYVYGQADIVDSGLTIRNVHSFNLHTKLNFKLVCSSITFHKWFRER